MLKIIAMYVRFPVKQILTIHFLFDAPASRRNIICLLPTIVIIIIVIFNIKPLKPNSNLFKPHP